MAERELTPEVRVVAYSEFLRKGRCPNSGLPCEQVSGLNVEYRAAADSMNLAGSPDLPLGKATASKFYETSAAIHTNFDRAVADDVACLGGCALLSEVSDQG